MSNRYTLVLTGEVLPEFEPQAVLSQIGAYLRLERADLEGLAVRAPAAIDQNSHLGKLCACRDRIAQMGAQAEICPPDDRPMLFVRWDETVHGPLPHVWVEQRVREGSWPDSVFVLQDGHSQWQSYSELEGFGHPSHLPPEQLEPVDELVDSMGQSSIEQMQPTESIGSLIEYAAMSKQPQQQDNQRQDPYLEGSDDYLVQKQPEYREQPRQDQPQESRHPDLNEDDTIPDWARTWPGQTDAPQNASLQSSGRNHMTAPGFWQRLTNRDKRRTS
jgi:hypothetical protein